MSILDRFISPEIRTRIEDRYYARTNHQACFEQLIQDPSFLELWGDHVGLFSDHGVVHMNDVAQHLLDTLENIHGVLIPERSSRRFSWMQGYGVLIACLHDIGMSDFSAFGRTMHPESAAQAVFSPDLDDVVEAIWSENSGNVAGRLASLAEQNVLQASPKLILRELLALSFCHSKSKASVGVLNNSDKLRKIMLKVLSTDLEWLYHERKLEAAEKKWRQAEQLSTDTDELLHLRRRVETSLAALEELRNPDSLAGSYRHIHEHYESLADQAYLWMRSDHPAVKEVVVDVIDTLRVLRCADALRQRGTVLKTSGSYEIFVDQHSANAIYALREGDDRLFLLELDSPVSAGEANIASSELDLSGDLRISFHRGNFTGPGASEYAAECGANVVVNMLEDVFDSFRRGATEKQAGLKSDSEMKILLEETGDNLSFAELVRDQIQANVPGLSERVEIVPSLRDATRLERDLYLSAGPFDWSLERRQELLAHLEHSGHLVDQIDPQRDFKDVKVVTVEAGQPLIEAGAPSSFVYIPFEAGLKIVPLGGYRSLSVQPWMPLGLTGVIRGDTRNATVVAERRLKLMMIPRTVYLNRWHYTYSPDTLGRVIQGWLEADNAENRRRQR